MKGWLSGILSGKVCEQIQLFWPALEPRRPFLTRLRRLPAGSWDSDRVGCGQPAGQRYIRLAMQNCPYKIAFYGQKHGAGVGWGFEIMPR